MPLKDFARSIRDGVVARERFRRANPGAFIGGRVIFSGNPRATRIGSGVTITGPTVISVADGGGLTDARLAVGEGTYIGEFNNIRCAGAPVFIGRNCLVSQHVTIVGSNHGTAAGTTIGEQPWHGTGVVLGDDVWVGAGAVILPGARLGDGCVVAANSVVRGEVAPGQIVAGSPATVRGQRR